MSVEHCQQKWWFKESIKPDNYFEDNYTIGPELGRGATAVVYKCSHKGTSNSWAVKVINKRVGKKIPMREICLLLKLKHQNIIRLKEVYETDTTIYMVLALVTGGELFDRIVTQGFYSEKDAARCVQNMLEAVKYLHENDVVHRDLKPENLLYEDNTENSALMLADFGLATMQDEVHQKSVCGTPGYIAPEILKGTCYNEKVDMWSIGVILYILLSGYEPFYADSDIDIFKRIIKADYHFDEHWDSVSINAKDLISRLLVLDPKKRLSASQALQHPWVKGVAAKSNHMEDTQTLLKKFNANRKIKAAAHAIMLANNLVSEKFKDMDGQKIL